ncbi:MAG: hypothetical protein IJT34_07130 [Butyrivibrio sp.]|nr:hypothetical protein [Butyrivibrio sp.]
MKKNGNPVICICDADRSYLQRLDAYLRSHLKLPVQIHCFTDAEGLMSFIGREQTLVLIISSRMLGQACTIGDLAGFGSLLVLEEEPVQLGQVAEDETEGDALLIRMGTQAIPEERTRRISKYRESSGVVHNVLELCMELPEETIRGLRIAEDSGTRRIALYSPVHGLGQTSLSLALAQLLGESGRRVLLLNLEPCAGWSEPTRITGLPGPVWQEETAQKDEPGELLPEEQETLTELLYYAECSEARFALRLQQIRRTFGAAEYIPPVRLPGQLREISAAQWQSLLRLIEREGGYDDLILDLSEAVSGLEELLSGADRILMLTGSDPVSERRTRAYERSLSLSGAESILLKTEKVTLPPGACAQERMLRQVAEELLGHA